jgi:sugar transferase (PEP-CTERM/EpsH1 system associated)
MDNLLFLSHRIPYPPDKGEKIRAWHIFRHLARFHRMHLGCLIDSPPDWEHVPMLRAMCADMHVAALDRRRQKWRALLRLRPGRALTPGYFFNAGLQRWVDARLAGGTIDRVFVFSSGMAGYVMQGGAMRGPAGCDRTLDMVDVDSEKWAEYAARAAWPARLVWAREGRLLRRFERAAAASFDRTLLVSADECARFAALAPEAAGRVFAVENGVDLARFSPDHAFPTPFGTAGPHVVFTGTMNYWPNADAVSWFVQTVLPGLLAARPGLMFHIVGANPTPEVLALAPRPGVAVTGRVADVRPYVAHADVVVAPLRIARGIQNKVLEAMAMGRPVVASPQAHEGVRAWPERDLLVAEGAAATQAAVGSILEGRHPGLGAAGRAAMVAAYGWESALAGLDAAMGLGLPDAARVDAEPGDTEPGDTEPGDAEPGDAEPGDVARVHP